MKTRLSNWREESDLYEVVTGKMTDKEALKKVDEKKGINNKVIINPKLSEAMEELGGEVVSVDEALAPSKQELNIMKKVNRLQLRLQKEKKKTTQKAEQIEKDKEKEEDIAVQQEEVGVSSSAAMAKARKEAQLKAKEEAAVKKAKKIKEDFEAVVEYFYAEGINEEGIDLIIEEVGLDDFVDFVDDSVQFLSEERAARKMNVRTLKATQKKAEEIKASKKDVVKRGTPADTLARARAERSLKKPKLAKPVAKKEAPAPAPTKAKKAATVIKKARKATVAKARKDFDGDGKRETPKQEHRGVRNKKITKAVAKAKPAQPKKPASKEGLRAKIKSAYEAGVKRHRKATQGVRVFHKGMKAGAKKAVKFAKDVKKVVSEEELLEKKKKPSVHDDYYDPMEDPTFDPHEAEATRGQSGRGTSGKMNVRKKYPVKEEELKERLGGKGYKSYTSLTGKKVSGDWEDSDRGAGNKAKRRAGGKVEKKSPTYRAYVLNKEEVVDEKFATQYKDKGKLSKTDAPGSRHDHTHDVDPRMADYVPKGKVRKSSKAETRANVLKFDMKKEGFSNWRNDLAEKTLSSYIPSDRQGEARRANLDYVKAQLKKKEDESTKNRGDLSKRDAGKMAKERLRNKKIMSMGEAKVDTGTPEEKEKARNVRKFGVSHNVSGHGKLRRALHRSNRGDKKIKGDKSAYVEMESVIAEKDLNAAERRALPNKDFVFPGKGEGPEGKQRGAYPIPDKKHARNALAMAAAHASPAKQAKVKAAVKKKFPGIQVSESRDKALDLVRASIIKKHGKGAIYDPKNPPKPPSEAQKKKAAAERKKRQDADNKAYAARAKKAGFKSTQDYTNVVARYGSEDNYRKGKGLGT